MLDTCTAADTVDTAADTVGTAADVQESAVISLTLPTQQKNIMILSFI